MYIPSANKFEDKEEILSFVRRFGFANMVTYQDGKLLATPLPFIAETREDELVLISHFAKANGQWKTIENNESLVIFDEPHAYISPSNYVSALNVPTWNYIAVHCYGQAKIVAEKDRVEEILYKTIENFEQAYQKQWATLPSEYKDKLINGIVAFELTVDRIQAKKKLSQNRDQAEQEKIIENLESSSGRNEQIIAEYMKGNKSEP